MPKTAAEDALTPLDHIIASTLGGFLTTILVCPLDVAKTRLQAQNSKGNIIYRNTLDAIMKITKHEGMINLWRGLVPSLIMTVPATTLYFTSYEKFTKVFKSRIGKDSFWSPFLAGSIARIITATISSPLEMLRTFAQSKRNPQGMITVTRNLLKTGGIRKLWTGLTATLFRDVPFSAIYWTIYEKLRRSYFKSRGSFSVDFASGAIAGSTASLLTNPFDVLKTRYQMNIDEPVQKKVLTLVDTGNKLYSEAGIRGFFKGAFPRTVRIAPACAIMISCYQFSKKYLLKWRVERKNGILNTHKEI